MIVIGSALCLAQATASEAGESRWQLRVAGLSLNQTGSSVTVEDTGEQIPYNAGGGFGYRF